MKLILAPLRGITNAVFRKVYHKCFPFFDSAIAPFISPTAAQNLGNGLLSDLLPKENENSIPLEPQILLNNPDVLYPFLDKIYELGYRSVNINMGCPAQMVVKKNKGAALLERRDIIEGILKRISADRRFEFSLKLRLGMTQKNRIFDILDMIEEYNPKEIILHPRTAQMQYSGEADLEKFLEFIDKITSSAKIIYNGDVFSVAKYQKITSIFGDRISAVMIGRGALVNPLLCGQIKGEKFSDPSENIRNFVDLLYNVYKSLYFGEKPILGKMKELWKFLRFLFEDCDKFAKKILKCDTLYAYERRSAQLFEKCEINCNKEILTNIKSEEFSE